MNKIIKPIIAGLLFILITTSCEFNNEEELYGKEMDAPTEVSELFDRHIAHYTNELCDNGMPHAGWICKRYV